MSEQTTPAPRYEIPRYLRGGYAIAYAAGLFDGEGSIGIYERSGYFSLVITLGSTDRVVVDYFHRLFGVGTVVRQPPRDARRKEAFYWRAVAENAADVLDKLRPFLILKARRADLAIRFQVSKGEPYMQIEHARMARELCSLNSGKGRKRAA